MSSTQQKRNTTITLCANVHDRISKLAEKEKRSVSGQIEFLLERALSKKGAQG